MKKSKIDQNSKKKLKDKKITGYLILKKLKNFLKSLLPMNFLTLLQ